MKKIRCLLVDDEPPAIDLLKKYVSMIDLLEVVDTAHSAMHAFDKLKNKRIDLIFLDIRMPVLNGLDFIKTLQNPPAIIITTAYREYALDGYDLDIIDYLLKPISFERFLKAIDRYQNKFPQPTSYSPPEDQPDHIFCNINRTYYKIVLKDILYVQSLKDYVRVYTTTGRLIVRGNLGTFYKRLPKQDFIRVHRSYIIAVRHIKSYNKNEVMINETSIPIGLQHRDKLKDLFRF